MPVANRYFTRRISVRKRLESRPQLEGLETRTLLSAAALGAGANSLGTNALLSANSAQAPQVESVHLLSGARLSEGAVLDAPPTGFVIEFNEAVNLPQLFQQSFLATGQNKSEAAYVHASDGSTYYLRAFSYTDDNVATFLLYNALPNGEYQLELSGPAGLQDLQGNPLAGNDPSGKYVVHFTVDAAPRGTNGNPLQRTDQEPNDKSNQAQDLGVLFPDELVSGVVISRDFAAEPQLAPNDTADNYRITLLQKKHYTFVLSDASAPAPIQFDIFTASGDRVPVSAHQIAGGLGAVLIVTLDPGTYTLRMSGWTPDQAPNVAYQLNVSIAQAMESPPALPLAPSSVGQISHVSGGIVGVPSWPAPMSSVPSGNQVVNLSGLGTQASTSDVPSAVVLALGTGPIGADGATLASTTLAEADVYDRVNSQAPSLVLAGLAVRLPILLQAHESGTNEDQPHSAGLAAAVQAFVQHIDVSSWRRALDIVYGSEAAAQPSNDAVPADRSDTGPASRSQNEESETSPLRSGDEIGVDSPQAIAAPALAVAAFLNTSPAADGRRRSGSAAAAPA
jgi:hypothetical protein